MSNYAGWPAMERQQEQPDGTVGIVPPHLALRLRGNRVAMNGNPVKPRIALNAWQQLGDDPRSVRIDSEPATYEHRFASLVTGHEPTPNLSWDAWLAALALSLDCEVTTFDRECKSFGGPRVRLLHRSSEATPPSPTSNVSASSKR